MRKSFKRIALVAMAVSALLLAPAAAANASEAVVCGANSIGACDTGTIAANAQYHCLRFIAHRAWWGDMHYGIVDNDTGQFILWGTIHWWQSDQYGTIYGLYGQHYHGFLYESGTGAYIEITNDCTY